jgi:uncharacterized membrane protein YphA (DoxX/SURF4 family)
MKALTWILTVVLALVFVAAGVPKLIGAQAMVQAFAQYGFGQWLRYLTGVLEIAGAAGILIPGLRFWGALLLACVMAGATLTNIFIMHTVGATVLTIVLMVIALALAWLRRP